MDNKTSPFQQVYQSLTHWLDDIKNHEVVSLIDFVEQTKAVLFAAEQIPEQQVKQFMNNLRFDLDDFYQQYQSDVKHSLYLNLLNESVWTNLSQITDKAQVEWAELQDDFEHDGKYQQGDFIGFGQLQCHQCQQIITYSHAATVSDCIGCGGNTFTRLSMTP
jgi:hypothetical protein